MDEITDISLATICSQSMEWHSYRKEFAPLEQILSYKSVIEKTIEKSGDDYLSYGNPFHSRVVGREKGSCRKDPDQPMYQ